MNIHTYRIYGTTDTECEPVIYNILTDDHLCARDLSRYCELYEITLDLDDEDMLESLREQIDPMLIGVGHCDYPLLISALFVYAAMKDYLDIDEQEDIGAYEAADPEQEGRYGARLVDAVQDAYGIATACAQRDHIVERLAAWAVEDTRTQGAISLDDREKDMMTRESIMDEQRSWSETDASKHTDFSVAPYWITVGGGCDPIAITGPEDGDLRSMLAQIYGLEHIVGLPRYDAGGSVYRHA